MPCPTRLSPENSHLKPVVRLTAGPLSQRVAAGQQRDCVRSPVRRCVWSWCVHALVGDLAKNRVNKQHIVTHSHPPTLTLPHSGKIWPVVGPQRRQRWLTVPTPPPPLCSHLSSPPPLCHRCTPPGHASTSAVVSRCHAEGNSGGLYHIAVSRHHSEPLWAVHRWGSSRNRAPAPSPRSPLEDGSWPASPQNTLGSGWPGRRSTLPPATGCLRSTGPSRLELLLHCVHAPLQPRHLHTILCPLCMVPFAFLSSGV